MARHVEQPTLPQVTRLLSTGVEGQIDLKLLIRGVLGHDDSLSTLSRLNQSSHQMLEVLYVLSARASEGMVAWREENSQGREIVACEPPLPLLYSFPSEQNSFCLWLAELTKSVVIYSTWRHKHSCLMKRACRTCRHAKMPTALPRFTHLHAHAPFSLPPSFPHAHHLSSHACMPAYSTSTRPRLLAPAADARDLEAELPDAVVGRTPPPLRLGGQTGARLEFAEQLAHQVP